MLVSSTNAGLALAVFHRTTPKEIIMTNFIASIASTFASFKLQRSRAKALKAIRGVRASVRAAGVRPEPKSSFANGKGLVWGSSKFQAVDLSVRDRLAEDTNDCKWSAVCTHAH